MSSTDFRGKKILIIEKYRERREFVSSICSKWGANVLTGGSYIEALTKAFEERPDLIIFHADEEKRSGIYACKVLKSLSETRNIPIILTTFDSFHSWGLFYNTSSFDAFIEEPYTRQELADKVKKVIKG